MPDLVVEYACRICDWKSMDHNEYFPHTKTSRHTLAVLMKAEKALVEARLKHEEATRA